MINIEVNEGIITYDLDYVQMLLCALREARGLSFKPEDYRLILGRKIIEQIEASIPFMQVYPVSEKDITFCGIKVEIDEKNLYNVQIFENITDKIGEQGK